MVAVAPIKSSLATTLPSSLPNDLTAVFFGATSGIGKNTLGQFTVATKNKSPRIYIVGRSLSAFASTIQELCQINPSASIEFIEKDSSLLRDVNSAVQIIKKREQKVDYLILTIGFISFEGRKDTVEGLEPSMTTRFYSRALAVQQLLPLLNRSANPHVLNVAAAGKEAQLLLDDLDLSKTGNYSIPRAAEHSITMLTLTLEKYAQENPNISFVHSFPGLTATPLLYRGSSGITGFFVRNIVAPFINTFVASSVEDVGARTLFYATNARYTVPSSRSAAAPIPQGMEEAKTTKQGLFLVNEKSDSIDNEKLLEDLRASSGDLVASHVSDTFARALKA